MESLATCIAEWMRLALARRLLRYALHVLPQESHEYLALARALKEAREYDRYVGYTRILHGAALPFDRWLSEWRGMTRLRRPIQMPQRQESNERAMWGAA